MIVHIFMYADFVPVWVQSARKLRNICGSWCGGLAFLQSVLNWNNFFVNVNIFPNAKTDCLYIYYVHYISYSSDF